MNATTYDRREVTASSRKPLYGHDSMQNAYLVEDYPYGSLRCKIKYWLESDPKKGFRFVSQTENPKNGRWNNPKKSTYAGLAGCMFLDEKDHVQWYGLTEYSDYDKTLQFIKDFPHADLRILKVWCQKKIFAYTRLAGGKTKLVTTINGEPIPNENEEHDLERYRKEAEGWAECLKHL